MFSCTVASPLNPSPTLSSDCLEPLTSTTPAVGWNAPARVRNREHLPAPLRPIRATLSPSSIRKLMSSNKVAKHQGGTEVAAPNRVAIQDDDGASSGCA